MESTQLTENYYRMVCSNGMVTPEGETVMVTPDEVFERMEEDEKDEAIDACANCPHMGQCSEPIAFDCPIDG